MYIVYVTCHSSDIDGSQKSGNDFDIKIGGQNELYRIEAKERKEAISPSTKKMVVVCQDRVNLPVISFTHFTHESLPHSVPLY